MKIVEDHIIQQDDGKSYSMGYQPVTDLADTYMGEDATVGDIFRASQKEHGRCVSKVYLDRDGSVIAIGWVFQKREKYEDDPKQSFIHETWVSLYDEWYDKPVRKPHVID